MTPADFTIPFYQGAKWEFTFAFTDTATGDPLDLTGLGPFVLQVKNATETIDLATATAVSDYDATGLVTFSFTAVQTLTFPIGFVRVGVRDALNSPYMQGRADVLRFTPTPA